jgi:tRNA pseudouridine55 synthase
MDGLLVVDKPAGPTSHDVVARARRLLRERSVGHTGTLDPIATGVLPLVVGRATRLARFLSASDKTYEAVVALGYATDTGDSAGTRIGDRVTVDAPPTREAIDRALDEFRGTFLQQPPVYSAKKIAGRRSYQLARARELVLRHAQDEREGNSLVVSLSNPEHAVRPAPVEVTVHRLEVLRIDGCRVTLRLDCSTGFYVRSLAHDLGERLATGAHLAELRRTRSGDYTLDDAIPLDAAERDPAAAVSRLIPPARMLQRLPALALSEDGVRRVRHGQDVPSEAVGSRYVRLMDSGGDLIGIAEPAGTSGLLHPFVVLG